MTIVEFCVFAPAYIVFVVVMFAHLVLLFGFKPGSTLYSMAYHIICKTSLENLFCVLVTIPSALGIIARVLYGACRPDAGFWDTMICNAEAEANALPQDLVMLTFLAPVVTFVFLKGVRKETIIILWVIASGSTLGCVAYLGAWRHIWGWIIPTVCTPVIAYEFERSKIAFFLQSRKSIEAERRKRVQHGAVFKTSLHAGIDFRRFQLESLFVRRHGMDDLVAQALPFVVFGFDSAL